MEVIISTQKITSVEWSQTYINYWVERLLTIGLQLVIHWSLHPLGNGFWHFPPQNAMFQNNNFPDFHCCMYKHFFYLHFGNAHLQKWTKERTAKHKQHVRREQKGEKELWKTWKLNEILSYHLADKVSSANLNSWGNMNFCNMGIW